jgi:hypothetical protein
VVSGFLEQILCGRVGRGVLGTGKGHRNLPHPTQVGADASLRRPNASFCCERTARWFTLRGWSVRSATASIVRPRHTDVASQQPVAHRSGDSPRPSRNERVSGRAAARQPALGRSGIASDSRPTPIETPILRGRFDGAVVQRAVHRERGIVLRARTVDTDLPWWHGVRASQRFLRPHREPQCLPRLSQ